MTLTKVLNGKKVLVSEEEEARIRAEWEKNAATPPKETDFQLEDNIQNEIRKIAKDKIKNKKQKKTTFKELFDNFEQRELEPHSDDELVELRKDVQMLKQMVAALLDNVVKENKD